jgi:hypothetical protein
MLAFQRLLEGMYPKTKKCSKYCEYVKMLDFGDLISVINPRM